MMNFCIPFILENCGFSMKTVKKYFYMKEIIVENARFFPTVAKSIISLKISFFNKLKGNALKRIMLYSFQLNQLLRFLFSPLS